MGRITRGRWEGGKWFCWEGYVIDEVWWNVPMCGSG